MRWLKRIGLGVLALLAAAILSGAAYEMWARHRIAAEFLPRGTLVDIGGRRIHLDCRGSGAPIVVFESGLDMYGSLSWSAVQDQIARTTRACSYDRAGVLWSDRAKGARNGAASAASPVAASVTPSASSRARRAACSAVGGRSATRDVATWAAMVSESDGPAVSCIPDVNACTVGRACASRSKLRRFRGR